MHRVEAFCFFQTHMQRFHPAQFKAGVVDSLNDVTRISRAHCVRFDDSEGKIAHMLSWVVHSWFFVLSFVLILCTLN